MDASLDFESIRQSVPGISNVDLDDENKLARLLRVEPTMDTHLAMTRVVAAFPTRSIAIKRPTLTDVFIQLVQASGGTAPALSELNNTAGVGAGLAGGASRG